MRQFMLPDLGEGLEEAEIVTWYVNEGDHVITDQLFDVSGNDSETPRKLPCANSCCLISARVSKRLKSSPGT